MTKTLNELIDTLTELREEVAAKHDVDEDVAGEIPVRIAYQPNYPLECAVDEITALPETEQAVLDRLNRGQQPRIAYSIYIAAGDDNGYAPKAAWEGGVLESEDEDSAGPCPECESIDTEYRSGSAAGLDVTVRECNDCGHQWDHT